MRRTKWTRATWSVLALLLTPPIAAPASTDFCEVRYEQLDLGSLNSFSRSAAHAVNNRGHVTGNSAATTFLWSCGTGMEDIGQSIGQPDNVGVALNERDQVIVYVAPQYPQMVPDVLLWQRGKSPIVLDPNRQFFPEAITNSGAMVYADRLWTRATGLTQIDLGIPIVSSHLTNLGRLGGVFFDEATLETRIYTWTRREGVKDLGSALGESTFSMDINDRGDLLVDASSTDLRTAYIMDREGNVELLPRRADVLYLYPTRMNLHREVIGAELTNEFQPNGVRSRNFVWDAKHGYRNLDELVGYTLGNSFEAASINDWGWIVGNRRDFNSTLLVPVPAQVRRFENLNRLRGQQLCRALDEVKLHRLLCSVRD